MLAHRAKEIFRHVRTQWNRKTQRIELHIFLGWRERNRGVGDAVVFRPRGPRDLEIFDPGECGIAFELGANGSLRHRGAIGLGQAPLLVAALRLKRDWRTEHFATLVEDAFRKWTIKEIAAPPAFDRAPIGSLQRRPRLHHFGRRLAFSEPWGRRLDHRTRSREHAAAAFKAQEHIMAAGRPFVRHPVGRCLGIKSETGLLLGASALFGRLHGHGERRLALCHCRLKFISHLFGKLRLGANTKAIPGYIWDDLEDQRRHGDARLLAGQ